MSDLLSATLIVVLGASAPVHLDMPPPPSAPAKPRAATPGPTRALKIALFEPVIVGDVPARPLAAFKQALPVEFRKLDNVNALSNADIQEILGRERTRAVLGCTDDSTSCMEELAGALDADETITVELTLVNQLYSLSARRVDARHARVLQSLSRRFAQKDGEELLALVGPLIQALYPERALKPGAVRGVAAEAARKLNPPPLPRWSFFTAAAATAVAGGVGATFGLLSNRAQTQFSGLANGALISPVDGPQLVALAGTARSTAATANIFFVATGVLAVSTGVVALLTDWNDDRAALRVGPVALTGPGGTSAGFVVSGGF